ncbi:MAG: hypothetical protein U0W24_02305 [Bacteroidales bacterium]
MNTMPKKNKKKNPHQLKAEQAHQKNLYLNRIKKMMNILGCADAFDLLGKKGIAFFYRFHLRPIKFINPASGLVLLQKDLDILNDHISHSLQKFYISIGPNQVEVSYYDFYTLVESIHFFWRNCSELDFPNAKEIKEKFKIFNDGFNPTREEVHKSIEQMISVLMWSMSDLTRCMVWLEKEPFKKSVGIYDTSFVHNNYIVHIEKIETITVELDGIKRKVYRLGMIESNKGINWWEIEPEKLGLNGSLGKMPIKIYIQLHAIERMKERLGEFINELLGPIITLSMLEKLITRTPKGGFLFAVRYMSIKLGYLEADLVGNILVIRTFLFITNNGTPEGNKLEKLLSIKKEDKKYLGIDKLDCFLSSDIKQNPELKKIFEKAGCGNLFKMDEFIKKKPATRFHSAQSILKYLCLDKKEQVHQD